MTNGGLASSQGWAILLSPCHGDEDEKEAGRPRQNARYVAFALPHHVAGMPEAMASPQATPGLDAIFAVRVI